MPDHPPPRSYGRTKARKLKPRQAGLVDTLLTHLALDLSGPIDLEALFCAAPKGSGLGSGTESGLERGLESGFGLDERPSAASGKGVVLEIGFGGGEHLAALAAADPEQRFI